MPKLLLFISILFSLKLNSQNNYVHGKVVDRYLQKPLKGVQIKSFKRIEYEKDGNYCADEIVLDSTLSDENGSYELLIKDTGKIFIECFLRLEKKFLLPVLSNDSIYIENAYTLESFHIYNKNIKKNIELEVYCPFHYTKDVKICISCQKSDKVQYIKYGLQMRDDSMSEEDFLKEIQEKCFGGCVIRYCQPTKCCKRCNIEF